MTLLAGWTAPTFEAQVAFDPDIDLPTFPGGNFRQSGVFQLDARGSFAFGGSLSYFFNEHFAVEGRVDTIDFQVDTVGPRLEADIELVPGIPLATAVLDVPPGSVNVERLFPLSFNVKARTGGRARFAASGGVSYLPRLRFDAAQPVTLAVSGLGLPPVEVARVVLSAGAVADTSESRFGLNGGVGLEVDVAPHVALVGDLRLHRFEPQTFTWQRSESPGSAIDEILLEELEKLPPIEIDVIYFHVAFGLAFRF